MTGNTNALPAERLIEAAVTTENPFPHLRTSELLAAAQVHATLALAAATALAGRAPGTPQVDYIAWCKTVSEVRRDDGG